MRKLIAAFKVSLDGRTEGPESMADWADAWSEDYGLASQIDACLLGGGMYPGYERYWTGIQADPGKVAWIKGTPPTPGEVECARVAADTSSSRKSSASTTSRADPGRGCTGTR